MAWWVPHDGELRARGVAGDHVREGASTDALALRRAMLPPPPPPFSLYALALRRAMLCRGVADLISPGACTGCDSHPQTLCAAPAARAR